MGCPVVGESVGDPVGGLVGCPVCGLVDVAVCGLVRAVCGPVETRPAPYSIQWPAGFRCLDIGRASRGFRVSHGLALRWCCSVAEGLRWSGQWSQSMVRSVVRSVVWSGGPVGGLVGGPVSGPVGGLVCDRLWSGPCGLWSGETRPAPYNGLPASNAWILVARGLCSFVTFVILRSPDPGPRTLCPQNVVRAASWRSLEGAVLVYAVPVSAFIAFL